MKMLLGTMLAYNYAEHRQLWEIIAGIDPAIFLQESGYSIGSLQREVVHIIRADGLWFARAIGEPDPLLLSYETLDRDRIRAAWDELEKQVLSYVAESSDTLLHETMTYQNPAGKTITRRRWELLMHLANHGTVHRAEMCAILHMLGHTVDFDVSLRRYLEERP